MTDALVSAKIPYTVDFHVPRGRKIRETYVWEVIPLCIRAPTDAEAPIAYRIARIGSKTRAPTHFEIRRFGDRLWWPVLDNGNGRRAAKDFLEGLAAGERYPLELMQLTNVPHVSSTKPTFDEWFSGRSVREVVQTLRDAQVARAQRGASETIICDDVVYIAAGEPVYFGFPSRLPGDSGFLLSVAASPWALDLTNCIPGPDSDDRRRALFAANVFDVLTLDKDVARLEGEGFSVRFDSKIETLTDLADRGNALHMCANAALYQLLTKGSIAAAFLERIPDEVKPRIAANLIPLHVCREALRDILEIPLHVCRELLRDIVEIYPPQDQSRILGDAILCAQSVLKRLDESLTQEDEEALVSLFR